MNTKENGIRKGWLILVALSFFCMVPQIQAQLVFDGSNDMFSISVTNYEYPYLVTDLNMEDTGENLIVTGKLIIEKNATIKETTEIKLGYESIATKDAKLKLVDSNEDVFYDSSYVATGEEKDKTLIEYAFGDVKLIEGTTFTYTLPRTEGEIHFGENSTILTISVGSCGLNIVNDISAYEYGGGNITYEFAEENGFLLTIRDINGREITREDAGCTTGYSTYASIYSALSANRIPHADTIYNGLIAHTKFYINQTWSRGNSSGTDIIYSGYPFAISRRTYNNNWESVRMFDNNALFGSDCGEDLTGSRSCRLNSGDRLAFSLNYADWGLNRYFAFFDESYLNNTNNLMIGFSDGSYEAVYIGANADLDYYYLNAGTTYALNGIFNLPSYLSAGEYRNQTYDNFLISPNPIVNLTGNDTFLFNDYKVIHINDTDANENIAFSVIPNSLNLNTYWYFDFPNVNLNRVFINFNGILCSYTYNVPRYTLDSPCLYSPYIEVERGGMNISDSTGIAFLNFEFISNESKTINITTYYPFSIPPIPEAIGSSTFCLANGTLVRRLVTNVTINNNNTLTIADEILFCEYGCGEWLVGVDCLPSDFMITMYAVPIVMVAGFIVFRFPRFVKKKKRF